MGAYEEHNQPKYNIDETTLYHIVKSLDNVEPFEVEVDNGLVTKSVVRVKYNDKKDISIVFRDGIIITAWLNERSDLHSTLDRSKYERKDIIMTRFELTLKIEMPTEMTDLPSIDVYKDGKLIEAHEGIYAEDLYN
jgi:hypothetical protein